MGLKDLILILRNQLSSQSRILTDHASPDFTASLKRWSDLGSQTPGAIISLANERDVVCTVREALNASIPFVPACGGHSPWSTIGKDGFILDLGLYKDVVVDAPTSTATVKGGLLMKDFQLALSRVRQFTTVGNGNTVGVIPYFINGGISVYSPLIGYGCENILSARLVSAKGEIIEANEDSHPDLLWAVRGAGQFFGVVLELCIRTYPFDLIGNPEGSRQLGTYVFRPDQANEVCHILDGIITNGNLVSAGHLMVTTAPPDFKHQILLVAPQCFESQERTAEAFRSLVELGPIQHMQTSSDFATHSDQLDWVCAKGDFKRFSQIGLESFRPKNYLELIDLHSRLLKECPGAERSTFTLEWHSPSRHQQAIETAFGNRGVDIWLNLLTWYTDAAQHQEISKFDQAAQKQMRVGTEQKAFISYTNTSREDPIEYRYKGAERLLKLKALKKEWDPKGTLTEAFL